MSAYYSEHARFLVSVDCIIFGFKDGRLQLLIGKRQMDPGRGAWSLYGGFVKADEDIDTTAKRTLTSLTGLSKVFMRQVGAFGAVDRDPGERVISVAYYALINVADYDDRLREKYGLQWFDMDALPPLYSDHKEMIGMALTRLRRQVAAGPAGLRLLPDLFTLTQLQRLYEAVFGKEMDKRNFRKRIQAADFIEKTALIDKSGSKRGAALYRFNKNFVQDYPDIKQ